MLRRLPFALLAYAQVGYPLLLAAWARIERPPPLDEPPAGALPPLSLVIAAHDEERVIERKVANALAQGYPGLEVIVACDGCTDATAELARAAGARTLRRRGSSRTRCGPAARARAAVSSVQPSQATITSRPG